MKVQLFILVVLAVLFTATTVSADKGGCMGCTIVATILTQIAGRASLNIQDAAALWCTALAGNQVWIVDVCKQALGTITPEIQRGLDNHQTPSQTCAKLNLCTGDDTKCTLWPRASNHFTTQDLPQTPVDVDPKTLAFLTERDSIFNFVLSSMTSWSELGAIKPLEDYEPLQAHKEAYMQEQAAKVSESKWYHRAWVDTDKDGFSTFAQGRGFNWRGKDCNDLDGKIYPGRKDTNGKGPDVDHNCNGIYGTDTDGVSFEQKWCSGTKQFNYVGLGDSATAHFALPPCFLSGDCIASQKDPKSLYSELLNIALNEVDFPQCSLVTGYNETLCPSFGTRITKWNSFYDFGRSRNPCSHRAYANIGVNGARSTSMCPGPKNDGIITSFTPDKEKDHPYAVWLSLIGNDVCNKSPEVSSMTSEQDYYDATLQSLDYLDSVLPSGSYVYLGGLVRGSLLYNAMGEADHPIGAGIKYKDFYDYLNCFQTSPCAGWLNTNKDVRLRTDEHAIKLNVQAQRIVDTKKFKNFELRYLDIMGSLDAIFKDFIDGGYDPKLLIEGTDGFHPSSITNSVMANRFTADTKNWEVFPENPFKHDIFGRFGNNLNGY